MNILKLKFKSTFRQFKELPLFYKILISLLILILTIVSTNIKVPITKKSIALAFTIHLFIGVSIKYNQQKRDFLKQYKKLFVISYLFDYTLVAIPFYIVNVYFGIATIISTLLLLIFRKYLSDYEPHKSILPSKIFLKQSFMWHSKMRYLIPICWMFTIVIIVVAYLHQNYNLAVATYSIVSLLMFLAIIFQTEDFLFVKSYINYKHFIKESFLTTIINAVIFLLPLTILMLFLFKDNFHYTLLLFLVLMILSINMVIVKYIFYPLQQIGIYIYFVNIIILMALGIATYGLSLPFYFIITYLYFIKNIKQIFNLNETNYIKINK